MVNRVRTADRCLIWKAQPSFFRERKKAKKASLTANAVGRAFNVPSKSGN